MRTTLLVIITVLISTGSYSQIRLPKLISDNMVLQRDAEIKLWGWASPGEKITLQFKQNKLKATTSKDGKWEIYIRPQEAGGPFEMVFSGSNKITVRNILFGDVWICSGQSNMVLNMERVREKYPNEIESANFQQIRNFYVPTKADINGPADDLPDGSIWKVTNPENVLSFGAVTFFFARNIHEKYNIPVGIINSSVGGTIIEAWTSEEGLKEFPELLSTIQNNKDTSFMNSLNRTSLASGQLPAQQPADKGLIEDVKWHEISYIPKGWRNINIPGYWEDQGLKDFDGVVWYRKEIDVPESLAGKAGKIYMGRIVDADALYLNGKHTGYTSYQYPPRRYELPAGLLKAGKNILVIRVTNNAGKGGFVPDKPYHILINKHEIDLKGIWQYKVGEVYTPRTPVYQGIIAQDQPSALYNAMVAPINGYASKGFIWYQGESNTFNPENYDKLLMALINDWRTKWNSPEAPFLFVQLPNFSDYTYLPSESNIAVLRNNQRKVLAMPNTAMVVTTDCGEWNDIHPLNKKDIGCRLALAAQGIVYNEDVVYSGPLFESAKVEGEKIILSFTHTGSGLITNDGESLRYFSLAGADENFVWADAVIEDNKVIVRSSDIKLPKYIRYNWADNPDGNLYNKEGLPASPFSAEISLKDSE